MIVGGKGPRRTPALAARFADEFNVAFAPIDVVTAKVERVAQACADADRDPAQIVDQIGRWREQTAITRVYVQVLDLTDLDQLEVVAAEVAPQLA